MLATAGCTWTLTVATTYPVLPYPNPCPAARRDYCEELRDSLDLVVIGAWYGNGRKAGWLSPFLLAAWDPEGEQFQSVCRCMSGFTDQFYAEVRPARLPRSPRAPACRRWLRRRRLYGGAAAGAWCACEQLPCCSSRRPSTTLALSSICDPGFRGVESGLAAEQCL